MTEADRGGGGGGEVFVDVPPGRVENRGPVPGGLVYTPPLSWLG